MLVESDRLGDSVELSDRASRHLRKVLRLRDGAALSVTDGKGGRADGVLHGDSVRVGEWVVRERPVEIRLCVAVSKGAKLDLVVEKVTEIGVARISPMICGRSERRWDQSATRSKVDRWRAIAVSALEQSRGVYLPVVDEPEEFDVVMASEVGSILHTAEPDDDSTVSRGIGPVVAIGPGGGFTDDEIALSAASGWSMVSVAETVLRTETAAIVAATLAASSLRVLKVRKIPTLSGKR